MYEIFFESFTFGSFAISKILVLAALFVITVGTHSLIIVGDVSAALADRFDVVFGQHDQTAISFPE